jgi:hypothetical protein
MTIEDELLVLHAVDTKSILFPFMKNISRWELLLTIAQLDGNPDYGIWNYIDMLHTKTENPMTLYAFLKVKIEEGSLVKNQKRKEKSQVSYLERRAQLGAETIHDEQRDTAFARGNKYFV